MYQDFTKRTLARPLIYLETEEEVVPRKAPRMIRLVTVDRRERGRPQDVDNDIAEDPDTELMLVPRVEQIPAAARDNNPTIPRPKRRPTTGPVDQPQQLAPIAIREPPDRQPMQLGPEEYSIFWDIIESLHWADMPEGNINARQVQQIISSLSPERRQIFTNCYQAQCELVMARLQQDGMFERNNCNTHALRMKVVSYVIALGRDTYALLMDDLEFLESLIVTGECQSLDAILERL